MNKKNNKNNKNRNKLNKAEKTVIILLICSAIILMKVLIINPLIGPGSDNNAIGNILCKTKNILNSGKIVRVNEETYNISVLPMHTRLTKNDRNYAAIRISMKDGHYISPNTAKIKIVGDNLQSYQFMPIPKDSIQYALIPIILQVEDYTKDLNVEISLVFENCLKGKCNMITENIKYVYPGQTDKNCCVNETPYAISILGNVQ